MEQIDASRLIEMIRRRPVLWNNKHKDYYNRNVVNFEWSRICELLQISNKKVAKCKWKSLRDCFRRELRKGEAGSLTATKWPFFEEMSFLIGIMETNSRLSARSYCVKAEFEEGEEDDDMAATSYEATAFEEGFDHQYASNGAGSLEGSDEMDDIYKVESFLTVPGDVSSARNARSFATGNGILSEDHFLSSVQVINNSAQNRSSAFADPLSEEATTVVSNSRATEAHMHSSSSEEPDGVMYFFKSLVPYMKILPPLQRLSVQAEMQNVLIKALSHSDSQDRLVLGDNTRSLATGSSPTGGSCESIAAAPDANETILGMNVDQQIGVIGVQEVTISQNGNSDTKV